MAMARTRLQWLGLRAPGRLLSPGSEALARSADLGNVQSLGSEFRHQGAKPDWDNAGATWIAAPGATPRSTSSRTTRSPTTALTIETPASGGSMSSQPALYRLPKRSAWES